MNCPRCGAPLLDCGRRDPRIDTNCPDCDFSDRERGCLTALFDDLVLENKSGEASRINNDGLSAQMEYLAECYDPEELTILFQRGLKTARGRG